MTLQNCRSCGHSQLAQVLDLGFAPPSNSLLRQEDLSKGEVHYPLVLLFCQQCKLVQTKDFHSSEALFLPDYPYLSGTSKSWVRHSHVLVDRLISEFQLDSDSLVGEIASNDGYLLDRLNQRGIPSYGIEPTQTAARISTEKGHRVYNCFLNLESAHQVKEEQGTSDIIIANNVFAHVPNLRDFTEAATLLLSADGVLVVEVQDFSVLLKHTLFDTIYHEHFSYFTLISLNNLLTAHGLFIFRVENLETHGGSIRVYAKKNDSSQSISRFTSLQLLQYEPATNLSKLMSLQNDVEQAKREIRSFFYRQLEAEKVSIGIGAAAKGNTLINFVGLDKIDLRFVCDSASSKHGKFLPGSHLPIFPMEEDYLKQADNLIVLPWNLSTEFSALVRNLRRDNDYHLYVLFPNIKQIGPHV